MNTEQGKSVEPPWRYRFHAVAFLDLMGQRQLFHPIIGVPQEGDEAVELKRVLGKTVIHIQEFRRWFRDMFGVFQAPSNIPEQIPSELHEEYRQFQRTELH